MERTEQQGTILPKEVQMFYHQESLYLMGEGAMRILRTEEGISRFRLGSQNPANPLKTQSHKSFVGTQIRTQTLFVMTLLLPPGTGNLQVELNPSFELRLVYGNYEMLPVLVLSKTSLLVMGYLVKYYS